MFQSISINLPVTSSCVKVWQDGSIYLGGRQTPAYTGTDVEQAVIWSQWRCFPACNDTFVDTILLSGGCFFFKSVESQKGAGRNFKCRQHFNYLIETWLQPQLCLFMKSHRCRFMVILEMIVAHHVYVWQYFACMVPGIQLRLALQWTVWKRQTLVEKTTAVFYNAKTWTRIGCNVLEVSIRNFKPGCQLFVMHGNISFFLGGWGVNTPQIEFIYPVM